MSENIKILKNFSKLNEFEKVIGLMGKEKAKTIIFKTRFGIHTFFLKFPIDLVILSKEKKVVFIKRSIKPNRVIFWNPKYDTVIELPEKSVDNLGLKIGSILEFNL